MCTLALIRYTVAQVSGPSKRKLQDLMYNCTSDKQSPCFPVVNKKENLSSLISRFPCSQLPGATTMSLGYEFV